MPSLNATHIWKIKIIGSDTNGLVIGIDSSGGKYKNNFGIKKKKDHIIGMSMIGADKLDHGMKKLDVHQLQHKMKMISLL